MDETHAREVASWWHGGQSSALYAFTSTGHRSEFLAGEVRQCLAEVKAHIGHYTQDDIRNLRGLMDYLASNTPTIDTFRDWYGNGDQGEEYASDGMGNGACLYQLDNGELWIFQWDDAGFEDCGQVTREEWERISGSYYVEEDEA